MTLDTLEDLRSALSQKLKQKLTAIYYHLLLLSIWHKGHQSFFTYRNTPFVFCHNMANLKTITINKFTTIGREPITFLELRKPEKYSSQFHRKLY